MSGDLGSLVVSLTANTVEFKDALTKAAYQMDQNMGQMVASIGGLQKSLGAVDAQLGAFGINLRNVFGLAAAGGLATLIAGSIESAAHIQHLAESTGIAADQLAAMKAAAAAGGTTLDDVARASEKFSKAIETQNEDSGKAAEALSALGLDMAALKDQSPAEQMHAVAERMNEFANGSGKAAAAQVLFGKTGADILPFLRAYGEQINLTKEGYAAYAEQAHQFEMNLGRLKAASQSIINQYAQELLPSLNAVVEGFVAMNSSAGGSVGVMDLVGEAVRVLALGVVVLWTAVKDLIADLVLGAKVAFYGFKNDLAGVADALEENRKKVEANDSAMLAFYDKVQKGSLIMGEAGGAATGLGSAAEAAKPKIEGLAGGVDDATKAMNSAVDAAVSFHDKLIEQIETLGMDEVALLRYKAAALGLGDSEDANIKKLTDGKAAIAAHTKATQEAETALKKLVDAEAAFHDALQKQIDLIGASSEEILKYDAREKGLGASQDALIHLNVTLLQQEADKKTAFQAASDYLAAYINYLNDVGAHNQEIINSWIEGNRVLSAQVDQLGLSRTAIDLDTAAAKFNSDQKQIFAQTNIQAIERENAALIEAYNKRVALIISGAERQANLDNIEAENKAMRDSAALTQKTFDDTAKSINKSLVDSLYDGLVRKGESFGQTLKSALESMFKNLILRPILQPLSDSLAGLYQQGSSGIANFFGAGGALGTSMSGGGDLTGTIAGGAASNFGPSGAAGGSWAGALGGAAIGGSITSQYGSKSPYPGMVAGGIVGYAATAGIAAAGTALAAGATAATAATTAFAAAAAAVPVIGWIVAAIAIIASFMIKPGGGPKVGSFQSANFEGGAVTGRSGWDSSGGGDSKGMNANIDSINSLYQGYITKLGGKAIDAYSIHSLYETDPQGTASKYGMVIIAKPGQGVPGNGPGQANTQTMDTYYNSGKFDPTGANFSLYAERAVLAALQQSQLPDDVAALLDSLIPDNLNTEQIQNVLAYAAVFHQLPQQIKDSLAGIDGLSISTGTSANLAAFGAAYSAVLAVINGDPGKDARTIVDNANLTAIDKFHQQGDALRAMATAFDGSATSALNLAQATATYYQSMVQLLAALEQSSMAFHKSIQGAERTMGLDILDTPGKQEFYRKEFEKNQAVINQAKANPSAADPSTVASAAETAKQDLLDWWNTLDAGQKASQIGWFTTQMDALDSSYTAANKAIADSIRTQNDPNNPNSPIGQVKSAFDKFMLDMNTWLEKNQGVSNAQISAATTMSNAADTISAAGDTMLTAANTPSKIDLNINGTEVTAGQGG